MKKIFIITFSIIITFIILTLLYARFIGTTGLNTNEIVINDKDLPKSFSGLKIVHFSDLHYGRIITKKRVKELVNEINKINPDIVIFTGDLIDFNPSRKYTDEKVLIEALKEIKAKYHKYAVIGNHDHNYGEDKLLNIYEQSDFILLQNEGDILYNDKGDKIFIGGVSNVSYHKADINKTMSSLPIDDDISYKIILSHEPDYADTIIKKHPSISLILSGHSHNGQITLPLIGPLITPSYSRKYKEAHYKIKNTDLYVSNGIGVSKVNLRLFNHPSINFFRINNE